jgi:hypothetical protein
MTPADLLSALAERGLQIRRGGDGSVLVCGPARGRDDAAIINACRSNRWYLDCALSGARSGHMWMACDQCSEVQLVGCDGRGRRCIMTPRCDGRLASIPMPWLVA